MTIRACPFRARAWWGDELLADSTGALRLERPGHAPTLWFPWEDVRPVTLRAAGTEAWSELEVERFDAPGPPPPNAGPLPWTDAPARPLDGRGVFRRTVTAPEGSEALLGHAVIDHDQACVELLDTMDSDDERDVTAKRFPTWGDASDLVAVLEGLAAVADLERPVVEGSQLLGQAIVAAMRDAPGRRVVSAHMAFLRAADATEPVAIALDAVTSGRTFTAFAAQAVQAGRVCAHGTLLLGVPAEDVVQHAEPSDAVPGPYEAVPFDMGVTGRDLRVDEDAYSNDPDAPAGPPSIDAWLRFRTMADDPAVHAGLLAQFTGHMSIAAALRPHPGVGQREAHRTLSMAINAISISFHADVRVDRWVLYRHRSTVVADGMAHSECRTYGEDGALLASFTVDAMIRPLHRTDADARTAL